MTDSHTNTYMPKVEVYTTFFCPYCVRAKKLLNKKGVDFQEIDVGKDASLREAMTKRAGGIHTVPQIFIDDYHVGGCDDLFSLDIDGDLDKLLSGHSIA